MEKLCITTVENCSNGRSFFSEQLCTLEELNGMWISERQQALNFRHRTSQPGYFSPWHVAGDPTLIIIRQGILRLTVRDGEYRDFTIGDQFIARDYLEQGTFFDESIHGHTAEVIGDAVLYAVHVKLDIC